MDGYPSYQDKKEECVSVEIGPGETRTGVDFPMTKTDRLTDFDTAVRTVLFSISRDRMPAALKAAKNSPASSRVDGKRRKSRKSLFKSFSFQGLDDDGFAFTFSDLTDLISV